MDHITQMDKIDGLKASMAIFQTAAPTVRGTPIKHVSHRSVPFKKFYQKMLIPAGHDYIQWKSLCENSDTDSASESEMEHQKLKYCKKICKPLEIVSQRLCDGHGAVDIIKKGMEFPDISEEEKTLHPEFFQSKNPGRIRLKSPEQYLLIRNGLIRAWRAIAPSYLTKHKAKAVMNIPGDNGSINRIHQYLEDIGLINVDVKKKVRRNQCIKSRTKEDNKANKLIVKFNKQPNNSLSGALPVPSKNLLHSRNFVESKKPHSRNSSVKKLVPSRRVGKAAGEIPNAFKMVECEKFSPKYPAPYKVIVMVGAMVIMDTHAHLVKTEVIGLVGGSFDGHTLRVLSVEPCESTSTSTQCDMDPVSQTIASQRILQRQHQVIGWYHSHPTFEANPSNRDLETQLHFQKWCTTHEIPFIGIIVSPYNARKISYKSQVTCLAIMDTKGRQKIPFQFKFDIVDDQWNCEIIMKTVEELVEKYSVFPAHVHMMKSFKASTNVTNFDKMIRSLWGYLEKMEIEMQREFFQEFKECFSRFSDCSTSIEF